MKHTSQVAIEIVSSWQHHMGFNEQGCFSKPTLVFLLSSLAALCVLVLKPVLSLPSELCTPESLRSAVWPYICTFYL